MMVIAFTWHTVYNCYTKEQHAKIDNSLLQVYVAHLMVQKEDKSLARSFIMSVLMILLLKWIISLEFCMVPTYQNDNHPTKHTKLQESIEKHKEIQDNIKMAPIPDLCTKPGYLGSTEEIDGQPNGGFHYGSCREAKPNSLPPSNED
jgi:hypothetical protein